MIYLENSAKKGNLDAVRYLSKHFEMIGGKENMGKAIVCLEELSKRGDLESIKTLANIYQNNEEGFKDFKKSCFCHEILAKKEDADSLFALGMIYLKGGFVIERDLEKSKSYFQKSHLQGNYYANKFVEKLDLSPQNILENVDKLSPQNSKKCSFCNSHSSQLKVCSRCKFVFYCSRECQTKDWKFHKNNCKKN